MSEFQYHEWQTIDRPLTSKEQSAVDDLSSHIEVSPTRAVVTYHWSNFRHDPKQVLLDYFDAYFYQANWGSIRLMFRFPKGLLETSEIGPYCDDEYVSFETVGKYQVLDIEFDAEEGIWVEEEDSNLSRFINLRADLLDGDYRMLYLISIHVMTFIEDEYEDEDASEDEYDLEPPVPPGLKELTPALENFIELFGIDPFLVQAAAEASPDLKDPHTVHYRDLISRLPRSECDDYLTRLAEGDAGVRLSLRKRLGEFLPKETAQAAEPRSIQQLLDRAEQLENAETQRQADEARAKQIAEMKALAQREPQTWNRLYDLLETGGKTASVYDQATTTLEKLKQLSEFQNTPDQFSARIQDLARKYGSRPSLMDRWKKRGWLT